MASARGFWIVTLTGGLDAWSQGDSAPPPSDRAPLALMPPATARRPAADPQPAPRN